jgi:peptidoglycan/xylan/chitin deacetylase (PgdA/CDA1 family)
VSPVVLCYHGVSETWESGLAVAPQVVERQVGAILARGYTPADAAAAADGRGRLLHVTFDDAFRSVEAALPALERLGVPATVFACPNLADSGGPLEVPELRGELAADPDELLTMDWEALRELVARGVEVGSHTLSHAHLARLADDALTRELRESKRRIEDELGRPCRFLAYPYGEQDARVRAAAAAAGYEAAFGLPGRSGDRFAVPRVGVYRKDTPLGLRLKTSGAGIRAATAGLFG